VVGVVLLGLAAVLAEEADLGVGRHVCCWLLLLEEPFGRLCSVWLGWENTFHLTRKKDFNFL
jgi:hypothetical protein